jgi:hypothetical protein
MTGQLPVRRASAADIDAVTSIVTLAFARDPLWGHMRWHSPVAVRRITPCSGGYLWRGHCDTPALG